MALAVIWTRLAADGKPPTVVPPTADEVRAYLVDVGLDRVMQAEWGSGGGCQVETPWLPLTRIASPHEWDDLLVTLWPSTAERFGDPEVTGRTIETMSELIDNAATHGQSDVGTFICGQRYTGTTSQLPSGIWVGIADAGVGLPSHLRRNPKYTGIDDDNELIRRAREPWVTGTTERRGWGLVEVFEGAAKVGPSWVALRSERGEGTFRLLEGSRLSARYRTISPASPGTWIHLRIAGD
ncbi:MAG: hypothetical protein ACYDD4_05060 [Acidimicrobiales bacterium]